MSATAKPARLWLKDRTAEGKGSVWYIKHEKLPGGRRSTGCGESDREGAQTALAQYIDEALAAHYQPRRPDKGDPGQVLLSEALFAYAKVKKEGAKRVARPKELDQRVNALLDFFGRMTLSDLAKVRKTVGASYAEHRRSSSAARRELEDLGAALSAYFEEDDNTAVVKLPKIELPPKPRARQRFLSRSEAARLIWAAWRYREVQKGQRTDRASRQHVARFILFGLYTGTRSGAICNTVLTQAIGRGYVDLDKGLFYRLGLGDTETKKRQPPIQLPKQLHYHLKRWQERRISNSAVIEYEGQPVKSVKKAFARAAADAGLSGVTAHTLRHTAVSWAMQEGVPIAHIAKFFGMTAQMVESVYGHLDPGNVVGDAITRRGRREGRQ